MSQTVADKSAPQATPVQATPVATETKKGGGTGKCLLIGCCAVIACCVLTVGGMWALVSFGGASLLSSNKTSDATLTRVKTEADAKDIIADTAAKQAEAGVYDENTGKYVVTFTEKDILALVIEGMKIEKNPNLVGVKVTSKNVKVEIELSALVDTINETSTDGTKMDSSSLKGIFASLTVNVGADGKSISVEEVSLGNGFIDSIIGPTIKEGMNDGFKKSLLSSFEENGMTLEKIELRTGEVVVTLSDL